MYKKIIISSGLILSLNSNSYATFGEDAAMLIPVIESNFTALFTKDDVNLQNSLLSGKIDFNGKQATDRITNAVGKAGGKYGEKVVNIANSCFDMPSLPNIFESLDIGGLDFCGIGEVNDIINDLKKAGSEALKDNGKTQAEPVTKEKTGEYNGNNTYVACSKEFENTIKEKKKKGADDKALQIEIANAKCTTSVLDYEKVLDSIYSESVVTHSSDMNKGNSYGQSETERTNLKRNEYTEKTFFKTPTENSVDEKVDEIFEHNKDKYTDRISLEKNIELEYLYRYNPNYLFDSHLRNSGTKPDDSVHYYSYLKTLKNGDGTEFLKSSEFLNKPIFYLVPSVDTGSGSERGSLGSGVSLNLFELGKYEEASKNMKESYDKLDTDGKDLNFYDKMGGITPFTSSILAYKQFSKVMADEVYTKELTQADIDAGIEEGENGEMGVEFATLQGLKGVMFQLTLLNQQMENDSRSKYNIQTLNHEAKVRVKLDELNSNIEYTQTQNAKMILLLERIANSLDGK